MLHYSTWSIRFLVVLEKPCRLIILLLTNNSASLIIHNIIPEAILEKTNSVTLLELQYFKTNWTKTQLLIFKIQEFSHPVLHLRQDSQKIS